MHAILVVQGDVDVPPRRKEKKMRFKVYSKNTLERLIILNLFILFILLIVNIVGIAIIYFKTGSLKGSNIEAVFQVYFFLVIYAFIYFRIIKKRKE